MNSSGGGLQRLGGRLPLLLVIAGALLATVFVGAQIGQGEYLGIYVLLLGVAAVAVVLGLGEKYWLLIPIAFSFDLPAIPLAGRAFQLPELTIMLCTVVFACRFALNPRGKHFLLPAHMPVLLYTAWAALIFKLHPVGLMVMGSSVGGARFYFKIALACAAFLIMANQKFTGRDATWIIRLLIIGSIVGMIANIVRYQTSPQFAADPTEGEEGFYTWHQALSLPAMWITLWLFSRYKMREIFSLARPWTIPLFTLCLILAGLSGKRAGFVSVVMTAPIAALLRKERAYVLVTGFIAIAIAAILTYGQGRLFTLPLQAQRTLSYLPGDWDPEVKQQFQYGIDPFREQLRDLAWKKITAHPVVGEGYNVNIEQFHNLAGEQNLSYAGVLMMAYGSSWHNTWLGIWADLGLPAVLIWAAFWIVSVMIAYRAYRSASDGTPFHTLSLMILIYFIGDILRSWTGGHSADDPFTRWWLYGTLLGVANVVRQQGLPSSQAHQRKRLVRSARSADVSHPVGAR